jgi:hypothetical protein
MELDVARFCFFFGLGYFAIPEGSHCVIENRLRIFLAQAGGRKKKSEQQQQHRGGTFSTARVSVRFLGESYR